MRLETRKLVDHAFAGSGVFAIVLLAAALLVLLAPIFWRGAGAICFTATVEHRRFLLDRFERGDRAAIESEWHAAAAARAPVYELLQAFDRRLASAPDAERRRYAKPLRDLKKDLHTLLGPAPGAAPPPLPRDQYGQPRWDRAQAKLERILYREEWDYAHPAQGGVRTLKPRAADFAGTPLEPLFGRLQRDLPAMLRPRRTCYWRFLTDKSFDAHFFGGIWPELLGTFYLTTGAMLLAVPLGLVAALCLTEYRRENRLLNLLRTCISTLAGVPSVVFGLFGLAFFINSLRISASKSVLAGSMTLALMILPTVIRAAEEAIRAVPRTYREAALSLGAGRWHTVWTIILPAALPGILTGTIISMGRAAGETAPIIFTAAVSVGPPLALWQTVSQPTPALSWNIYNLVTEHRAVDDVRHVQYGMVLVLVSLVLLLNLAALILRARVARRLRT